VKKSQKIESMKPLLLSANQVAVLTGFSRSKIYDMQALGQLPPSLKIGFSRRWKREVVERWVELDCPSIDAFQQLEKGA